MHFSRRSVLRVILATAPCLLAQRVLAQDARKPSLIDPTPDDARAFAAYAVRLVRDVEGKTLDYSPASLKVIDDTVLSMKASGKSEKEIGATLAIFGCYVGEVLVRGLGAAWEMPNDKELKMGFRLVGVRAKSGTFWNPIAKVFKLFRNGKEDNVSHFYVVAKNRES
jgi:hypothetical protein